MELRSVVMLTPGVREPGGAAKHSMLLARGLARRGWSVTVISRESREWLPRLRTVKGGPRILSIPGFAGSRVGAVVFVLLAPFLAAVLGRRRSHYVGLQLASPALACSLAAAIVGQRPAILAFSSGEAGEAEFVAGSRLRRQRVALLRRAGVLVGQTTFAAEELSRLVPGVRTAVLPTPVAEPGAPPALSGLPHAAFSGRLTEGKGLLELLDAWESVIEAEPQARLHIIGAGGKPGGTRRAIDAEIQARVADRPALTRSVELRGWVDDVAGELARCDVYVFPSESEGMSNSLLEACALGRVVVASDIPANRAVLGDDYALLFGVGDRASLAGALIRAFTDGPLRTEVVAAIEARLNRFGVHVVVARLEELLEEIEV